MSGIEVKLTFQVTAPPGVTTYEELEALAEWVASEVMVAVEGAHHVTLDAWTPARLDFPE